MADLTLDSLQIEINSGSDKASKGIDALADSLSKLKSAAKGGAGLTATKKQLDSLRESLDRLVAPQKKIEKIVQSLKPLESLKKTNLGNTVNALKKLPEIMKTLSEMKEFGFSEGIKELVEGLKPLENLQKSNLNSTFNALKKFPEITKGLKDTDMDEFAAEIQKAANALEPLANNMNKISQGFQAFPQRIQRVIKSNEKLNHSNRKLKNGYHELGKIASSVLLKMSAMYFGTKMLVSTLTDFTDQSSELAENLNLFNVAMGRYSYEALKYAKRVNEELGIDTSEWIRNQGIFMQIATGFGIVEEKAYAMSKGLIKVSYDLSSFFNIPIEEAIAKVESGVAGELEPLRRLGYALDVATLQQIAYGYGIEQNITKMTQAQKAQLRYVAIMRQSQNAMGDMARTILTPANAMRILDQRILQLKRAVGNALIPVLIKALPYIQMTVIALTNLMNVLAKWLGFELPKIDYSNLKNQIGGVNEGIGETEEKVEDATKALKKLKDYTLGFDELNIIAPPQDSPGKKIKDEISTPVWGNDLGIELKDYDFLGKVTDNMSERAKEFEQTLKNVLITIGAIGTSIATIKVGATVLEFLSFLNNNPVFKNGIKKTVGFTLAVTGFVLLADGIADLVKGEGNATMNAIKAGLGAILGVAGTVLVLGSTPTGWAVGIGLAITVSTISFLVAKSKKAFQEEVSKRFGDLSFTDDEIKSLVNKIIPEHITHPLKIAMEATTQLSGTEKQLTKDMESLESSLRKLRIGIAIPQEQLELELSSMLENGQKYLDESNYSYHMAIDFFFGDSMNGKETKNAISDIYRESKTRLNQIGQDIKSAIANGFIDGEWIPDKLAEVQKLYKEAQQILNDFKEMEFQGRITRISLDLEDAYTTGDKDSIDRLKKQLQETTQSHLKEIDVVAEIQYSALFKERQRNIESGVPTHIADEIYNKKIAEVQNEISKKKAEIEISGVTFNANALTRAFGEEIGRTKELLRIDISTLWDLQLIEEDVIPFEKALKEMESQKPFRNTAESIVGSLKISMMQALSLVNLSPQARRIVEDMTGSFEPTLDQLEKIEKYGLELPESVRRGIKNEAMLRGLAEDSQAIYFLIGQQYGNNPEFRKVIFGLEKDGKEVPRALKLGMNLAQKETLEESQNIIVNTVNKMKETLGIQSPQLVESMNRFGTDISQGIQNGTNSDSENLKKFYQNWSKNPVEEFKKVNGINTNRLLAASPWNPAVASISSGVADALLKGFNDDKSKIQSAFDTIKNVAKGVFDTVRSWWTELISGLKIPDIERNERKESLKKAVQEKVKKEEPVYKYENYFDKKENRVKTRKIRLRASGGFPSTGEMFIARESGPELVGSIGSKSAVANNDQIVAAVSQGVYEAVMKAMSGGNDSQINVYMDGEEISKKVQKGKSGYPVMGGSAFGY